MPIKLFRILIRWTGIILMFILLLLLLAALFTQTPWCREMVRSVALKAVHNAIQGKIQIGKVKGNLLSSIGLWDITIVEGGDTVAVIPHLYVKYDLSGILGNRLRIDSLMIDRPQLYLRQHDDGRWNLLTAFAPAQKRQVKQADSTRSSFRISINRLVLRETDLQACPRDTVAFFPRKVRMSLEGSGSYAADRQELAVTMMRAVLTRPDMVITRCTFKAEHDSGLVMLRDFVLTTPANRIEINGRVTVAKETSGTVTVKASFPDLNEFAFIVPPGLQSMRPEIDAVVGIENGQINLAYSFRDGRQVIQGAGKLTRDSLPEYTLQGKFQYLNPAVLQGVIPGNPDLSGTLELQGQGFRAADAVARAKLSITDSGFVTRSLHLEGDYRQGNLDVRGKLDQGSGSLDFSTQGDVLADSSAFSVTAQSQNLDIAALLQQPNLSSRINLRLDAGNLGFVGGRLKGEFEISISPSMLKNFEIDSAHAQVRTSHGDFSLDSLEVMSPAGEIRGAGEISRRGNLTAQFAGTLRDSEPLEEFLTVEKLAGEGTFSASINGKPDSLDALWNFYLHGLAVNEFSAAGMEGKGLIHRENGKFLISGQTAANGLRQGNIQIDSLSVQGEYRADSIHAMIQAQDSSLFALHAEVSAGMDTIITLRIPDLQVTRGNTLWSNGQQPIVVNLDKTCVDIKQFILTSGEQSVSVEGLIAPKGISRLECAVQNADLLPLAVLMDSAFTSLGPLNARFMFSGRMENPGIEGTINSSRVAYGGLVCDTVAGVLAIRDSILQWDINVGLTGTNRVLTSGYIPLQYSAGDGLISRTRPIDIHLTTPGLDLSPLIRSLGPFNQVAGILVSDMHLTHSLQSPRLLGTISLQAGSLKSTALGLSYNTITMLCTGKGDSLVIDSCYVSGGKGTLAAKGTIRLDSGTGNRMGRTSNIQITAKEFEVADTPNYAATLNGTATVENNGSRFYTDGDLVLSRAHIYLPYFARSYGSPEREPALPMLVAATARQDIPVGPRAAVKNAGVEADTVQRFYGKIKVTIPQGTWVRGKTLNLELSGKLEIVRSTPAVELFGYIKCERGTYEFYGKKFVVKEGRLDFDGGKEINPVITLDLRYEFRDIYDQKQLLHMIVSSRMRDMTIRFTLGDEAISEGDAISYLLFGRRSDELSQSQQSGIANVGEMIAKDFTAGIISSQLSSTVGSWAGLDVVHVSGEDNWQKATFTAGKYVTNDIFASYERGLFTSDPNEPITEEARLDYKFTRFLYLRLTESNTTSSGVDLIIRIE